MECFYFNETYPAPSIPFDKLLFQGVTYVGDDYVSLLFNDVNWGPAHPYSALEGVTFYYDPRFWEAVATKRL